MDIDTAVGIIVGLSVTQTLTVVVLAIGVRSSRGWRNLAGRAIGLFAKNCGL